MHIKAVITILSAFFVNLSVLSQQLLPIPGNIKKAYSTGTRSVYGKPGQAYWQNRANYSIKINFDPSSRVIAGTVHIEYCNNSPDTLKQIIFKLYPNLYQKSSPRALTIASEDLTAGVDIKKITFSNLSADSIRYFIQGTNMTVRGTTILPKQITQIDIDYAYVLNKGSFVRTGQIDSGAFFIAYFFPRIAVYDDIDGWNKYPYTGQVEFYNDYVNFDVQVSLPGDYQCWATGILQNQREVYQAGIDSLVNKAAISNDLVDVVTTDDLKAGRVTNKNVRNIWKFKADNVTDFAFGLSNHYVWKSTSVIINSLSQSRSRIDAVYNPDHISYRPVIDYARKTVAAMTFQFPAIPFPYPHETIFDGPDEMEFPMMVDNNPFENKKDAIALTAHEIFHSIFPFYVGTNETKYSFMDEGFATMAEFYLYPVIDSGASPEYDMRDINTYSGSEEDVPVMTLTPQLAGKARFLDKDQKPALAFYYLKEMLGEKLFLKGLHYFIDSWNGKHPTPYDMFNCINTGCAVDLNWYWDNWFFEKHVPDLSISSVKQQQNNYTVTIANTGGGAVPLHLTIYLDNGKTLKVCSDAGCWKNHTKTHQLTFETTRVVDKISLGDTYDADINKMNNVWMRSMSKSGNTMH